MTREVDVTGEFITNWHLPGAAELASLESLEELGEILANAVVVLVVSQVRAQTHQVGPLRQCRDGLPELHAETNRTLYP